MSNAPTPSTPALTGIVIGQTERATRAVLEALLAETGTTFHHWVLLHQVAIIGPAVDRARLVTQMTDGLKIGPEAVMTALDEVVALGLATASDDETVALAPAGTELHGRIAAGLADVTTRLYRDLPANDLETTRRVLTIVTQRANQELAHP